MTRTVTVAAMALALATSTGCGVAPGDGPIGALERARAQWVRARPQGYRYGVQRNCFCIDEARGPVYVTVSGEAVVGRAYVDGGDAVPEPYRDLFPSVDGLFDLLRDALERDAYRVTVTYDPDTGVPLDLFIDYEAMVADEELGFAVVDMVRPTG